MSTALRFLRRWPSVHPVRCQHFHFLLTIQRLNRLNLLWLLSWVSATPFATMPSDIFSQFARQCISNNSLVFDTMAGGREREAELDCLDDMKIVTWHLHLLDLRTALAHTGWWMAICAGRWSSCRQTAPTNSVLLHENWDGFHLLYVHLCDLEHMVPGTAAF